MKTKKYFGFGILSSLIFFAVISGCSNSDSPVTSGSGSSTSQNIGLSIMRNDNALDNPLADTLIITSAKALINEVEVENQSPGTSVHVNPFVIYFNSNGSIQEIIGGQIPAGTYTKIKFKIHKPEDNETPPDPEFKEGTSGNQRYSFIIKGTYNGSAFVYKSKQSASLILNFPSGINFATTKKNITVIFNKKSWFYKNGLKDPNNSNNENEIDDNIRTSFKNAFLDDDKNGQPDN
ncbi:MAG: hypothetical protein HY959_11020 [Ignavibacteriae bacterium]|nr:hypothetical protein [Ignavibacteriota bacterium]